MAPIAGQINIFDIMIKEGKEISEAEDVQRHVGRLLTWDQAAEKRNELVWKRYDLTSGTVYEAITVVTGDSRSMTINSTVKSVILRDCVEKFNTNGCFYELVS